MIALEVSVNGKRVCVAGAEDLSVLSANVTACGKLGKKSASRGKTPARAPDIHYLVGGLAHRGEIENGTHLHWNNGVNFLKVGDVVQIKIVEASKADRSKKFGVSKQMPARYRAKRGKKRIRQ